MSRRLEIVDAQVHLNQLTPDWRSAPIDVTLATAVAVMDAVGIDRVLIGETHGFNAHNRPEGEELPNGATRVPYPFSERAVELYPERFVYHVVIDVDDPEPEARAAELRNRPGVRATRIVPIPQTGEVAQLENGEFEPLLAAAELHHLPVFCWVPGRAGLLGPYIERHPNLNFIIDHCGVGVAPIRIGQLPGTMATSMTESRAERLIQFDRICEMASHPNVSLKWCHANPQLADEDYPYNDVIAPLRQAIEAFGVERIMWASDYTVARDQNGNTWAECLHYLLDSDQLSDTEKEWIFGGSVRQIVGW